MKVKFRGWSREVYPHVHDVRPVSKVGSKYLPASGAVTWSSALLAYGKFEDLALSGDFLAEFQFDPDELRNWITRYIEDDPTAAMNLLHEMQGEAILALSSLIDPSVEGGDA